MSATKIWMRGLFIGSMHFIFIELVFADDVSVIKRNEERISYEHTIDSANSSIRQSKNHFSCAGIGFIDTFMATDGSSIFFNEQSQELLCVSGMMFCVSPTSFETGKCNCPPQGWEANSCNKKYSEYQFLRSKKIQ